MRARSPSWPPRTEESRNDKAPSARVRARVAARSRCDHWPRPAGTGRCAGGAGAMERRGAGGRVRRRARRLRRTDHAAARNRHRRCAGPLGSRTVARREPGRPARSRRRFAQSHGPADALAGRGPGGRRAAARRARQPRGDERARRPALRRPRRIHRVHGRRIRDRARGPAQGLGGGTGRRVRACIRPEVSAWLFRSPRRTVAQGHLRPVAAVAAGCDRDQRHALHARRALRTSCAA